MRKSIVELQNDLGVFFPDNTTQFITPAKVREYMAEFLNAIRPAYGVLTQVTDRVQTVGLTPVKMLWSAQSDSTANQTSSSFTNGEITRAERGTSTINFTTDFECATGRFITFTLYKNGQPTQWRITGNGAGAGNPIAVAMTAIDYADPAPIYSIHITAEVTGVSVTLRSAALIVGVDPVNSFT